MSSLEKSLNEVMQATSCKYRGVVIGVEGTQYRCFGKLHDSLRDAEKAIDSSYASLASSIKRSQHDFQTIELTSTL